MAPLARIGFRRAVEAQVRDSTRLWIVISVIAGILALTGITTVVIISFVMCRRRCRHHYRDQRRHEGVSSKKWPHSRLPTSGTPRAVSVRESFDANHEYQRLCIIQKSLASRAVSYDARADNPDRPRDDAFQRSTGSLKWSSDERNVGTSWMDHGPPTGQQSQRPEVPMALADELKQWEARMQREGVRSLKCHPAIGPPDTSGKGVEKKHDGNKCTKAWSDD